MTTKEYLGQMRNIDRLIKDKLDEASKWRNIATNISVSIGEINVQTTKRPDKMSEAISLALDYEAESNMLATELVKIKHKITRQIDMIGDSMYYNILKSHYIREQSIVELAVEYNYSYKQMGRYFKRALFAFEEMYGDAYIDMEKKDYKKEVHECPQVS